MACRGCQRLPSAVPQEAGSSPVKLVGPSEGEPQGQSPRFPASSNPTTTRASSFSPTLSGSWGEGGTSLTRVGGIPTTWSRPLPAVPSRVTITKDCAGGYCASFVVAVERPQLEPNGNAVGLDLGWASLAVTRHGVKIAPPKSLCAALRGIRRLQWSLSRKARGSNNRATARLGRALAHATVADQRLDPLHKRSRDPSVNTRRCASST